MATVVSKNLIADLTSTLENNVALLSVFRALDASANYYGLTNGFSDEFNDASGIQQIWSEDQGGHTTTRNPIISNSHNGHTDASDTEVVSQSLIFGSGDVGKTISTILISTNDDGAGTAGEVHGDVFQMEIASAATGGTVYCTLTTTVIDFRDTAGDPPCTFMATTPWKVPDSTTTFWLRVSRVSGSGVLPISYSTGNSYTSGSMHTTSGGTDGDKDFSRVVVYSNNYGLLFFEKPAPRYDTTGDYLDNNTGGYAIGAPKAADATRGADGASHYAGYKLPGGRVVKSFWAFNDGGNSATGRFSIMRWNGKSSAPTEMATTGNITIANGGWGEHACAYTVPNDANIYYPAMYFQNHSTASESHSEAPYFGQWSNPPAGSHTIITTAPDAGINKNGPGNVDPVWRIEFTAAATNMDVYMSEAYDVGATITLASALVLIEEIAGTITYGTDVIIKLSADGGTTFETVALADTTDHGTTTFNGNTVHIVTANGIDLSSHAGQEIVVKVTTANGVEVHCHAAWAGTS